MYPKAIIYDQINSLLYLILILIKEFLNNKYHFFLTLYYFQENLIYKEKCIINFFKILNLNIFLFYNLNIELEFKPLLLFYL